MDKNKKIDFIKYMIEEASKEINKIEANDKAHSRYYEAKDSHEKESLRVEWLRLEIGSKQKVKDYLKMIRRMTLEVEKEM